MGVNYSGTYAAPRADLGVAFMEHLGTMDDFIALKVLPFVRMGRKSASFSALTRETLLQDAAASRAPRSAYNRLDFSAKDKIYNCKEYGLECPVDDSERTQYMNDFDAEDAATKITAEALMRQLEIRTAAAVFNTTTWTGASLFTDHSAAPWATAATDIIKQVVDKIEIVRKNCGRKPNALVIGAALEPHLLNNTGIRAQFPGAQMITLEMIRNALRGIFGLTKLLIGGAAKNTALEGQAFAGADVWGDTYAMVAHVAEEGSSLLTPCIGRTMLWQPDSPEPVTAEMYRAEEVRSDIVRCRQNLDTFIIDPNFGHLMDVKA